MAASWLYFFVVVTPAVVFGWMRGRRVVLNYRGGGAEHFFSWFGFAIKPVFRLADAVTVPSEFLAGVIRRSFQIPAVIVPNILDSDIFTYRQRTAISPHMVVTRHLEAIYDVESVLRAFRLVQQRHPEARLWIAGTGSQEQHLGRLVAEWDLRNVRFLGHVAHDELPVIYEQNDILVNASRVDNFPGALLEASAAGLVVVSTGAGGIPFIYQNGVTALLVEPGDWAELAAAVERVLESPRLVADLTKQAAVLAHSCDWRKMRLPLYETYADTAKSQFVDSAELGET